MPTLLPPRLRRVINAWGTATPLGVSRSPAAVADAVAATLQRHVVIAELQAEASRALSHWSGATVLGGGDGMAVREVVSW